MTQAESIKTRIKAYLPVIARPLLDAFEAAIRAEKTDPPSKPKRAKRKHRGVTVAGAV